MVDIGKEEMMEGKGSGPDEGGRECEVGSVHKRSMWGKLSRDEGASRGSGGRRLAMAMAMATAGRTNHGGTQRGSQEGLERVCTRKADGGMGKREREKRRQCR